VLVDRTGVDHELCKLKYILALTISSACVQFSYSSLYLLYSTSSFLSLYLLLTFFLFEENLLLTTFVFIDGATKAQQRTGQAALY
jgi:hypothetical protein